MGDSVSRYIVAYDGDASGLKNAFAGIKTQFKNDLADLQATANRVDIFANLQKQVTDSSAAFTKAKTDVDTLQVAIASLKASGQDVTPDLVKGLKDAQSALSDATRQANLSQAQFTKLQTTLQKSGVDTDNLASEQIRLAAAMAETQAASDLLNAKLALGSTTLTDIQPSLAKLSAEYEVLRTSGTLSQEELAVAEGVLNAKTGDLVLSISTLGTAAKAAGVDSEALGAELRASGAFVGSLSDQELKLAESVKVATAQQLLQSKSTAETAAQIVTLKAAYATLATSGASLGELSTAQNNLKTQSAALNEETGTLGTAFDAIKGKIIAYGIAVYSVIEFVKSAQAAANDFNLSITKVGSVSGATKEQLDALAQGARDLSTAMGIDLKDVTAALYDVLRSGVPQDNALAVLGASAEAAKASLSDLHTTTQLGTLLIKSYGVSVDDLSKTFDQFYQGQKDGGATLTEFAAGLGNLLPTAKALNVPLDQIIAAVQTMVRAGLDAGTSIASLQKILAKLDTSAAVEGLAKFGIQANGFLGVLQQIAAKGLDINQVLELGIGDARQSKALAALTSNFQGLNAEIKNVDNSVGSIASFNAVLEQTPQEKIEKFDAALHNLRVTVGDFIGSGTAALVPLTALTKAFNDLPAATKNSALEVTTLVAVVGSLYAILLTSQGGINLLAKALPGLSSGFGGLITGISGATLALRTLGVGVAALIGYKIGEYLNDNSSAVRTFGTGLVLAGATVVNFAKLVGGDVNAALTFNSQALKDNADAYNKQAANIKGQWTDAMSGANELTKQQAEQQAALAVQLKASTDAANTAGKAVKTAVDALASGVADQIAAVSASIKNVNNDLSNLITSIVADGQAADAAAKQALASIQADQQLRLAALDQSDKAEAARAKATLDIEQQAAADRLAIIQSNTANVLAAVNAEADARLQVAIKNGANLQDVETQIATKKRDTIAKLVTDYQAYIANLIAQEQGYLAKVTAIQNERLALNTSIEDKIRVLERSTLSAYSAYQDQLDQVDENNQNARLALIQGNYKAAADFAQKAITETDALGKEVKDDSGIVVSATTARTDAEDKYAESLSILNQIFDKRELSEKAGAAATLVSIGQAQQGYQTLQTQLDELQITAAKGIVAKLDVDTKAVDDALAKLDAELTQQEHLYVVKADITQAQASAAELSEELSKGITINVEALSTKISDAIEKAAADAPELQLKTDVASKALDDLAQKVGDLRNVKITVDTTAKQAVADAEAELDKLNKITTTSTHYIKQVLLPPGQSAPADSTPSSGDNSSSAPDSGGGYPIFNKGGRVDAAKIAQDLINRARQPLPAFAKGGPVFVGRVPGAGNSDTVQAPLESGSFVVRKAASQFYGDGLMQYLATFASGGDVFANNRSNFLSIAPAIRGQLPKPGQSVIEKGAIANGLGGTTDQQTLSAKKKEASSVIQPLIDAAKTLPYEPLRGQSLADYLVNVLDLIDASPDAATAEAFLSPLRDAAANYLASIALAKSEHVPIIMGALTAAQQAIGGNAFATGGPAPSSGGDIVPALLTPGEHVIQAPRVRQLGSDFMEAVNDIRVSKSALQFMLRGPRAPAPQRFADGGLVKDPATPGAATAGTNVSSASSSLDPLDPNAGAGATIIDNSQTTNQIIVQASAQDLFAPGNLDRYVGPWLDDKTRRKGRAAKS